MPRPYDEIKVDEILNYDDAHTGTMSRYDRIMQHRAIEAMNGLSMQLNGVIETIHRTGQLAQEKANEAMQGAREAAAEQRKQLRTTKALTWVLAISTALYTVINAVTAWQAHVGNEIQMRIAETAHDQVTATREANELQRRLGKPNAADAADQAGKH
jgi:hypothetical protein